MDYNFEEEINKRRSNMETSKNILGQRILYSDDNPVLYHYCSASTALEILKNHTIRFSDISLLNDAQERIWGEVNVFEECLNRIKLGRGVPLDFAEVPDEFIKFIADSWKITASNARFFAACFSKDSDSLSQWRAYADDASGFALGFSIVESVPLEYTVLKVEYDVDTQITEMFAALNAIYQEYQDLKNKNTTPRFSTLMVSLVGRSIAFKNPAFRAEEEIRLAHAVRIVNDKGNLVLRNTINYKDDDPKSGGLVSFEARKGVIVPYFDISFQKPYETMQLVKVILGPKCKTSAYDMSIILASLGYNNVEIRIAGAQYR